MRDEWENNSPDEPMSVDDILRSFREEMERENAELTDTEPTDTEPTDTEPADMRPADTELTDMELADTEPADMEPADAELTDTEPVAAEWADSLTEEKSPPPDAVPQRGEKKRERTAPQHVKKGRESAATRTKKKRLGFYRVLLLCVAVALALISVGLVIFWHYIDAYEKSRPDNVMVALLESPDYTYWEAGIEAAAPGMVSYFEDADTVTQDVLFPALRAGTLSYHKRVGEHTDEAPVYTMRLGTAELSRVTLRAAGTVGFGFARWEVAEFTLEESFFAALQSSVRVTASRNAEVKINGLTVSADYITESELPHASTYQVDGLFAPAEVLVYSAEGELLEPYHSENGQYYFPVAVPDMYSFTITAPADATVYVAGAALDGSMRRAEDTTLRYFGDPVGLVLPELVTYDYEGSSFETPAISATNAAGQELSLRRMLDGELFFTGPYSDTLKEERTATVDAFIRAYVGFTSSSGGATSFSTLDALLLQSSDLRNRLAATREAMIWVSGATVTYNALDIDRFTAYGEDCFTCEVHLDITNVTYYETRELEDSYELVFIRQGGRWLAAKMTEIQGG